MCAQCTFDKFVVGAKSNHVWLRLSKKIASPMIYSDLCRWYPHIEKEYMFIVQR